MPNNIFLKFFHRWVKSIGAVKNFSTNSEKSWRYQKSVIIIGKHVKSYHYGLEVRAIFRRECPKSTWHFRVLGTWQTMHFFAYWMLIGSNCFATNMTSRFQQTRDNQFRVSVWPTRDSKNAFFRADGHFFLENFETFRIFGICLTR